MGEEKFVFYSVTAVIIAAGELPLDFYKFPKTTTAFPAVVAFELHHTTHFM
jgi:hypothetical protein